jgi:hypothetical protein
MNPNKKTSRVLGIAFLLQFITSISSGLFIRPLWLVPGNISQTMLKIADNPWPIVANILTDMLTALGVIFLGAILFISLRKQNEKIALVALGFYILEAGLLATSRIATFSLLHISQEYVIAGQPDYLPILGNLAFESMDFVGDTLHALAFCLGGILFYYLLYKSSLIPRILSLWGLITILPVLIGTLTAIFNYDLPFVLFIPYVPFEFVVGVWILIKGIPEIRGQLAQTGAALSTN